MPKTDATPSSGADTSVKVTLVTLLFAWSALLAWALANAETLARPVTALLAGAADAPRETSLPELSDSFEGLEPVGTVERRERREWSGVVAGRRSVVPDGRAVESPLEARRLERLASLSELSSRLRFASGSSALSAPLRVPLEQAFEILFTYPDTAVEIVVTGNEHGERANELLLARARGLTIVDHLVSLGLERERFELDIDVGGGLPPGEHRVRVRVDDELR